MNPLYAKAVIFLASVLMIVIRAPHGQRSRSLPVLKSRKGRLERVLLGINYVAYFFPLLWIATPVFWFADYPLRPLSFCAGGCCLLAGLWLFHRSHADLGDNFSVSLEVREKHQLVTHGVYRRVRHPMYLAFFIYLSGQALVIPNWLAGPSEVIVMLLLFALRVEREERMMLEAFGHDYRAYMASTKRLLPSVW
ncbi:MAG TPA: protein-S-isoprenylcysteine O-methyltransferase [Pirellulales bacterium]|nr:protein-S-isoprenylcysteine O-methyltransferase [Pirellulales bacterium]